MAGPVSAGAAPAAPSDPAATRHSPAVAVAAYPQTRQAVVQAWATAWFARKPTAAARYEYHPGPGAAPYARLPQFPAAQRVRATCWWPTVCTIQQDPRRVLPALYVRQVKGQWKVVGVYWGSLALDPATLDQKFFIDACTTKASWLQDTYAAGLQPSSSVVKVAAGSWVRLSGNGRPGGLSEAVYAGKWYGAVDPQRAGLVELPSYTPQPAKACRTLT